MIVNDSTDEIIAGCDCMHITGKMQIDIFHRYHLRITTARRSAFNTKNRSKRWFTQSTDYILVNLR
ncbi:hypothetical protein SDC9_87041 [bioreactor metagenome]|uniref:Uncharacterized protein n=1 Tax=bioreactor metagenome TaxID=1076179 RepID=A0A644ZKK5_9ZZZZ